tara:strand:- start:6885 stop:7859 length:975 start_codon:yes stop_codon:yes gene_type:complete
MADPIKIVCSLKRGCMELAEACADLENVTVTAVESEPESIGAEIEDADALVINNAFYTAELAAIVHDKAARLRWIQFYSTGYNNAEAHGIPKDVVLTNAGSVYAPPVAEHALALVLALVRRLPHMERERLRKHFNQLETASHLSTLRGATLLAVGFGGIGKSAAKRALAFDMRVIGVASREREDALAERVVGLDRLGEVLPGADVIILSLPLLDETAGVFGAAEFAAMKSSAVVVNVGRGALVDEGALIRALEERRIAGAGLDVYTTEPLPEDSPLWELDNVIISPHVGGFGDPSTLGDLTAIGRDNVVRFVAGAPLINVLDIS